MNTDDQKLKFAMPSLSISEIESIETMSTSGKEDWGMGEV